MTAREIVQYIGKELAIVDQRTGQIYYAKIHDVRTQWGKIQVRFSDSCKWFEPTARELNE